MTIAVDFDGTCVTHEFPKIGKDIGAQKVLKALVEKGHELILYTMRCDHEKAPEFKGVDPNIVNKKGLFLSDAIKWFKDNDIPLYGVNNNPSQHTWTSSPKPYAHLYIDDAALGCALSFDPEVSDRPYVDWNAVEYYLKIKGIL